MYSLTNKTDFIHRYRRIDSKEHHLSIKKKKELVHNGLQNLRIVPVEKLVFFFNLFYIILKTAYLNGKKESGLH